MPFPAALALQGSGASVCVWQWMATALGSHSSARSCPPAKGEAADCRHMRSCGFVTHLLHGWLLSVLCSTFPTSLDTL